MGFAYEALQARLRSYDRRVASRVVASSSPSSMRDGGDSPDLGSGGTTATLGGGGGGISFPVGTVFVPFPFFLAF